VADDDTFLGHRRTVAALAEQKNAISPPLRWVEMIERGSSGSMTSASKFRQRTRCDSPLILTS
jgi:hypothetical protein